VVRDGRGDGGADKLVAPDTVDAYVRRSELGTLVDEHGLQPPSTAVQANVTLRAVPDDAWLLDERELAPIAAVALDLSFYTDNRSARAGHELLAGSETLQRFAVAALQHAGKLVLGGAFPAIDSIDPGPAGMTGSLIVAEFNSLEEAKAWINADPYVTEGVFAKVIVKPYRKVFPN